MIDVLTINKEFLQDYKSITIVLENCDAYEIVVEDILDIFCKAEWKKDKERDYYVTQDGFIKISERAKDLIEETVADEEIGTEWDYRLKERLEMCDGCADITWFYLKDKNNKEIGVCVPYDPLEDIVHGREIEYSNCPSLELDEQGNMIIRFGESSKQPKRKDNNYSELIAGWNEIFGGDHPQVLKVKMENLSMFGDEQVHISAYCKINNRKCKQKFFEFVFLDCENFAMDMWFGEKDCEMVMSKMADGRIYVGLYGLGIDFLCSDVSCALR